MVVFGLSWWLVCLISVVLLLLFAAVDFVTSGCLGVVIVWFMWCFWLIRFVVGLVWVLVGG